MTSNIDFDTSGNAYFKAGYNPDAELSKIELEVYSKAIDNFTVNQTKNIISHLQKLGASIAPNKKNWFDAASKAKRAEKKYLVSVANLYSGVEKRINKLIGVLKANSAAAPAAKVVPEQVAESSLKQWGHNSGYQSVVELAKSLNPAEEVTAPPQNSFQVSNAIVESLSIRTSVAVKEVQGELLFGNGNFNKELVALRGAVNDKTKKLDEDAAIAKLDKLGSYVMSMIKTTNEVLRTLPAGPLQTLASQGMLSYTIIMLELKKLGEQVAKRQYDAKPFTKRQNVLTLMFEAKVADFQKSLNVIQTLLAKPLNKAQIALFKTKIAALRGEIARGIVNVGSGLKACDPDDSQLEPIKKIYAALEETGKKAEELAKTIDNIKPKPNA